MLSDRCPTLLFRAEGFYFADGYGTDDFHTFMCCYHHRSDSPGTDPNTSKKRNPQFAELCHFTSSILKSHFPPALHGVLLGTKAIE